MYVKKRKAAVTESSFSDINQRCLICITAVRDLSVAKGASRCTVSRPLSNFNTLQLYIGALRNLHQLPWRYSPVQIMYQAGTRVMYKKFRYYRYVVRSYSYDTPLYYRDCPSNLMSSDFDLSRLSLIFCVNTFLPQCVACCFCSVFFCIAKLFNLRISFRFQLWFCVVMHVDSHLSIGFHFF